MEYDDEGPVVTKGTIAEVVTREYKERSVVVEPLYPRILVRWLPKEQMSSGGIVLTDKDQNKPVHEGVVLAVYKPFWQRKRSKMEPWMIEKSPAIQMDEDGKVEMIWQECAVKPGDHVLFPHMGFGITPVWPLDGGTGEFRLVEEVHALSVVKYETEPVEAWLEKLLSEVFEAGDADPLNVASRILKEADVVRRGQTSKTTSGA